MKQTEKSLKIVRKGKINNFQCAYTEIWPIEKLNPHPENTNTHPKEQVEILAKIVETMLPYISAYREATKQIIEKVKKENGKEEININISSIGG